MQDVARLAGVSVKTVSNVVNDYKHVSAPMRRRVQDAIDKLGYEVNVSARNLRTGRTGLITLALPELRLPYFAELAGSVIAEAEKAGLRVLVEQTNGSRDRELELLQGGLNRMVDGVIFSPLALGPDDLAAFSVRFPLVLLGERVFGSTNDHITMSNVEASKAATKHLLDTGHRRIAVIGTHPGEKVGSAALREQGFRAAMAEAGVPVEEALLRPTQVWHRNTGAEATDALIDSGESFDAVFALNDAMALGVLHSLSSHRIDVPGDVAVIGFDDIEDAAYTRPTLSTIAPGRDEIASRAVTLLQERIAEANTPPEGRTPIQRVFARYELVVRQSAPAVA